MIYQLRTELRRSSAAGTHKDKRSKRKRTRDASKKDAIKRSTSFN